MLKLRLISSTNHVHYLVPAEQAQALEVLVKTTYKDVPTCKKEIERMTYHKGVVQVRKRDWEDNIGTVFFSDDHAGDIVEFTSSSIKTSVKKGKLTKRKKKEESSPPPFAPMVKEEPSPPPSPPPFVPPRVDPPAVAPMFKEEEARKISMGMAGRTDYKRDSVEQEIDGIINEFMGDDIEPMTDGGVDDEALLENLMLAIEKVNPEKVPKVSSDLDVGAHNDNRIGSMIRGAFKVIDNFDPNSKAEIARRERNRKRRSVIVDWGVGFTKVLSYLSGVAIINSVYTSMQKVGARIPAPTDFSSFREIFFDNPAAYYGEYVKFASWVTHDIDVKSRLTDFLKDQDTSKEIEEAARKLYSAKPEEIYKVFNSIESGDRLNVIYKMLSPEKIENYWYTMRNEMYLETFDQMSPLENKEFMVSHGIGVQLGGSFDFVQERGMFSHEYTFGPNDSMGTLFNHAKLWKTGFDPFSDLTSIIRMVRYYTPKDYRKWYEFMGDDVVNFMGGFDELGEMEGREYRRSLWMGVGIAVLYGFPAFTTVLHSTTIGFKNIYLKDVSKKDLFYSVADLVTMASMFTVSMCQLKLLAEKGTDPEFSMERSFGSGSVDWYYTMGATQLVFTNVLRQYWESDGGNVGNSAQNIGTGLVTLSFISAINMYDNPDIANDTFFNLIFTMPMAVLAFTFATLLRNFVSFSYRTYYQNFGI